jgi:hypothetical protein
MRVALCPYGWHYVHMGDIMFIWVALWPYGWHYVHMGGIMFIWVALCPYGSIMSIWVALCPYGQQCVLSYHLRKKTIDNMLLSISRFKSLKTTVRLLFTSIVFFLRTSNYCGQLRYVLGIILILCSVAFCSQYASQCLY